MRIPLSLAEPVAALLSLARSETDRQSLGSSGRMFCERLASDEGDCRAGDLLVCSQDHPNASGSEGVLVLVNPRPGRTWPRVCLLVSGEGICELVEPSTGRTIAEADGPEELDVIGPVRWMVRKIGPSADPEGS